MNERIKFERLNKKACRKNLLETFNRYQKTETEWQKEDGKWVLKDFVFEEDWDRATKEDKVAQFKVCIEQGGMLIGAVQEDKLIGFTMVESKLFGSKKNYVNMDYLHVSLEARHQGIGKLLFKEACKAAKELGATKLYISSNPAEASQAFYRSVGCVWAEEEQLYYVERAPYDCQLEYVLVK